MPVMFKDVRSGIYELRCANAVSLRLLPLVRHGLRGKVPGAV
jgi:hypothetical protein